MNIFDRNKYGVKTLITHAGNFHADDLLCAAGLSILNPDITIERVFSVDDDEKFLDKRIIVADIGGGQFDHHQIDTPLREDGIKHCAFSRLWLKLGYSIVSKYDDRLTEEQINEVCMNINNGLVRTVALIDNGICINDESLYTAVELFDRFLPGWDEEDNMDESFANALILAKEILEREIKHYSAIVRAKSIVKDAISHMENGVITLDKYVPWEKEAVDNKEAKIVLYPSRRNEINLQLVPVSVGSFQTRISVPEKWCGTRGEDADHLFPGMTFCHANGFLCCFKEMTQAKAAANYIISRYR